MNIIRMSAIEEASNAIAVISSGSCRRAKKVCSDCSSGCCRRITAHHALRAGLGNVEEDAFE